MKTVRIACGVGWLAAVACGPLDLLTEPLTASCPTLTQPVVENLVEVLDDLEQGGMSRMDALQFAEDNCVDNSVVELAEDDVRCRDCASSVVLVVYDTF